MRSTCFYMLIAVICCSALSCRAGELGAGYGREFRGNYNLEQYELAYRYPLMYSWSGEKGWEIRSSVEGAMAFLREDGGDSSSAARFSIMPQVQIGSQGGMTRVVLGFGTGVMAGETEFTKHNLGGPFFFNSKLGLRLMFAEHFVVEYDFYHQSNAGIYNYNAGLNMNMLSVGYLF